MQDQTDIAAQHDTRSAVDRLLRENSRLRADCEAAQAEARQTEQTLASLRGLVRSALVELDERARANAEATVTLADVRAQVVFGPRCVCRRDVGRKSGTGNCVCRSGLGELGEDRG